MSTITDKNDILEDPKGISCLKEPAIEMMDLYEQYSPKRSGLIYCHMCHEQPDCPTCGLYTRHCLCAFNLNSMTAVIDEKPKEKELTEKENKIQQY